jgi:hypothetical protein
MAGMGSLALAAAVQGNAAAASAVLLGLLLGGAFFLYRVPSSNSLNLLVFTAIVLLSGLPFTPLWAGAALVQAETWPWGWLWGLILALLLIGCVKFGLTAHRGVRRATPGVGAVYVTGLLLSMAALVFATWSYTSAPLADGRAWWGGGLVLLLSAGWFALSQSGGGAGLAWLQGLQLERLAAWPAARIGNVIRTAGRAAAFMARLFEGDGSLLWALVLLGLIVTVFVQIGLGL